MGQTRQEDKRYYVSVTVGDTTKVLDRSGAEVEDFLYAAFFRSVPSATAFVKANNLTQNSNRTYVVRSVFVEINGFDLGEVVE